MATKPMRASALGKQRGRLLFWYKQNARQLPWRAQKPVPYDVLLSEFLLQQTQVATAIPYFERFKARFPDLASLAAAPVEDVLTLFAGLGYYRRARHLHAAARAIVKEHKGKVPSSLLDLTALPGIGAYTAAAIRAFAFDQPAGAVDANIRRVLSRFLAQSLPDKALRDVVVASIEKASPRAVNAALMELGALVCLPQRPRCETCPLQRDCLGQNRPQAFPAAKPRPPRPKISLTIAVVRVGASILAERRQEGRLLAGMLGLPTFTTLPDWLESQCQLGQLEQGYSHRIWQATIIEARLKGPIPDGFFLVAATAHEGFARIYARALQLAREVSDDDA